MEEPNGCGQLQKEFKLILSRFIHEIRNPLALISSGLQMLTAVHPELSEDPMLEDILDNLHYMQNLLEDFSGYQSAGQLSPASTDTAVFFKNIAGSCIPALSYLGILVETDIPDDLPVIPVDQTKLRQAFLNLIRNASESIRHSHGKICLSAAAVPGGISVSVSDNGCGITPGQLKTIFRPFVTYRPGGTGLGLTVTREIIEAHNGTLQVVSSPGEGTCFHVFLPDDTAAPPEQSLR